MSRLLFLAKYDGHGWPQCEDGPHSTPEGVAKAAKLHRAIFSDNGPWRMVEVLPVPKIDPPINEEAAGICRDLVNGGRDV